MEEGYGIGEARGHEHLSRQRDPGQDEYVFVLAGLLDPNIELPDAKCQIGTEYTGTVHAERDGGITWPARSRQVPSC